MTDTPDTPDEAALEASASARQFARVMKDQYVPLRSEGFTEAQTIALVGQVLVESRGE